MLIEMELREILVGQNIFPTIVLAERDGAREFTFSIGEAEVSALDHAVHGRRMARPFTHDLILNVIDGMGGTLRHVIVDEVTADEQTKDLTFHGKLAVELSDQSSVLIDSRPSDAIILATKLGIPVYVEERVLDQMAGE